MALWTNQANIDKTPYITLNGIHKDVIQNECKEISTLLCTCNAYNGTNSCCSQYYKQQTNEFQ